MDWASLARRWRGLVILQALACVWFVGVRLGEGEQRAVGTILAHDMFPKDKSRSCPWLGKFL